MINNRNQIKKLYFTLTNRFFRKKTKYNSHYWDEKASVFSGSAISLWPNETLNNLYHLSHLKILNAHIKNAKNKRVLDVGCGTGRLAYHFAEAGALIDAADWSEKTILQAKKNHPHEAINYYVKSIFDIDSVDTYDVIIVFGILNIACSNENELKQTLHILMNALKSNGQILIFEPIHDTKLFARNLVMSRKSFINHLQKAKLKVIASKNLHFLPCHIMLSLSNFPKIITKCIYSLGEYCLKLLRYKILGDYFFIACEKVDEG